jgi:dynein intermediate chain 2
MEHSIMQNIAVDIYEEYDDNEERELRVEPPSARTLSVFKDPNAIKRTVCDISWHPDGGKKVAGAYAVMQFQHWRMDTMSNISYIWDVNHPNEPEQELTTSSALCCLQYNPRDPHLLVGGCYNGLVSYWDTRKGSGVLNPVDSSILERSHCDPVYDVAWLPGKSPNECASTSTDGEVLWWDIRKLGEPLERLALEEKSAPGSATDGRRMGTASYYPAYPHPCPITCLTPIFSPPNPPNTPLNPP